MTDSPASKAETILDSLLQLPPFQDVVFRGWNGTDRWSSGAGSFVTTGLTPTSRDPRVASENFTTTGLYAIASRTGRCIEQFSADRVGREVVLLPSTVLVWGRQARVSEVRVTIIEEIVLGEEGRVFADQEDLERTIAARVLAAVDRPPVEIAQPGRFVGPFD